MKLQLLAACLFLFLIGCNPDRKTADSLLDYRPGQSFAILRINHPAAFNSDLKNNQFINALKPSRTYRQLSNTVSTLQYLQTNQQALLFFTRNEEDSIHFLLATPETPGLFSPDTTAAFVWETLRYGDLNIERYVIQGDTLFSGTNKEHRLLSSSLSLLRESLSTPAVSGPSPMLETLLAAANPEKSATLLIHLPAVVEALASVFNPAPENKLTRFSDWVSLDIGTRQDLMSMNGIAVVQDSFPSFAGLFRNINPLPVVSPSFAPETARSVVAYAIGDFSRFSSNRESYPDGGSRSDSLFHPVEEVGMIDDASGKTVLLNSFGSESILEFLSSRSSGNFEYQDRTVYSLEDGAFLSANFQPLIGNFDARFYTILENAFIFSEEQEALEKLIDHYSIEATFDKAPVYKTASSALADEANIFMAADAEGLLGWFQGSLSEEELEDLRGLALSDFSFSAQLVAEGDFFHIAFLAKRLGETSSKGVVAPWYTVQLDAPIATDPQLVTNHRTNRQEIVVQDENNTLYLISTEGKVLWKKALAGRIQGAISQVDLYKNGRLQMAFTTDNQFLILDRNGKEVAPFKISYPGGNLNALAVFDYDKNRNYRFVVTQGTSVFMYNNQGSIVSGFTYTKAENPIIAAPQHFRFGNRDYLVFRLDNGLLKILNRVGQTRIPVRQKIEFSDNEVYAYKNQFALTDTRGTLYMINEKGDISTTHYDLNQDHGMEATSKSLAFMNENVLNIKGKSVTLDFGVYTTPRIFYLYDTIYVSVTDLQSHKTYLFNSNAEPIPGFPVLGSATAVLGDMDHDRKLELVTRNQENTLVVYRLN